MAPCMFPPVNGCSRQFGDSSSWMQGRCKEIVDGCPPNPSRGCLPLIPGAGSCRRPPCESTGCGRPGPEAFKLPLVDIGRNICGSHPRDDCCRVPLCAPCLPTCPVGTYVEKVRPIRPSVDYEVPAEPFSGCSTYRTHFNGCQGARALSMKPLSSFDPSPAKMDGLTMYREQFTCKPICPAERIQHKAEYAPACAPMEGMSTYRVDFRGCRGLPAESVKRLTTFDPTSARMDGTTSYRHDFIPYCPAEYGYARGVSVKPQEDSMASCSPFEGCTTYRMDFIPKCCAKTPSMRPRDRSGFASAKFADWTTYRNDYLPFHFQRCPPPCLSETTCKPCYC